MWTADCLHICAAGPAPGGDRGASHQSPVSCAAEAVVSRTPPASEVMHHMWAPRMELAPARLSPVARWKVRPRPCLRGIPQAEQPDLPPPPRAC